MSPAQILEEVSYGKFLCLDCIKSKSKVSRLCLNRNNMSTKQDHVANNHSNLEKGHKTIIQAHNLKVLPFEHERVQKLLKENDYPIPVKPKSVISDMFKAINPPAADSTPLEVTIPVVTESFLQPHIFSISTVSSESMVDNTSPVGVANLTPRSETSNSSSRCCQVKSLEDINQTLNKVLVEIKDLKLQKIERPIASSDSSHTAVIYKAMEASTLPVLVTALDGMLEYDSDGVNAIIRCKACFSYLAKLKPAVAEMTVHMAAKHLNKNSHGSLSSGWVLGPDLSKSAMDGGCQQWYRLKNRIVSHIRCLDSDGGGKHHMKAVEFLNCQTSTKRHSMSVAANLVRIALTDVKLKAATLHYENLISLLDECGADVGNIMHGSAQLPAILRAAYAHYVRQTSVLLKTKLPSTLTPPHFFVTADKSTTTRRTNQATLIVPVVNGQRLAIPCGAPEVYDTTIGNIQAADAKHLASLIVDCIVGIGLPLEHLTAHLSGFTCDGAYSTNQNPGFKTSLMDLLGKEPQNEKFLAVWDMAHWLDLAVNDVRHGKVGTSSSYFKRLVDRVNKFDALFHRGRGNAILESTALQLGKKHHVTGTYSTTRFCSSAFHRFRSIHSDFATLISAFEESLPNDEEIKFAIKSEDFVRDLCATMDILQPLVDLMLKAQSLSMPIWKTVIWVPKLIAFLSEMQSDESHMPRLSLDLSIFTS